MGLFLRGMQIYKWPKIVIRNHFHFFFKRTVFSQDHHDVLHSLGVRLGELGSRVSCLVLHWPSKSWCRARCNSRFPLLCLGAARHCHTMRVTTFTRLKCRSQPFLNVFKIQSETERIRGDCRYFNGPSHGSRSIAIDRGK